MGKVIPLIRATIASNCDPIKNHLLDVEIAQRMANVFILSKNQSFVISRIQILYCFSWAACRRLSLRFICMFQIRQCTQQGIPHKHSTLSVKFGYNDYIFMCERFVKEV